MYQPSEELAACEQEKYSLRRRFADADFLAQRFVVGQQLGRGHLIGDAIRARHFVNCHFENLQLANAEFTDVSFDSVTIRASELRTVTFVNCSFRDFRLEENLLTAIRFVGCFFEATNVEFKNSQLSFENCYLHEKAAPASETPAKKNAAKPAAPAKSAKSEEPATATPAPPAPNGRFGNLDLESV